MSEITECPMCNGSVFDNRQKVAGGWKGPLFKCKDKDCGWVQWPPKGQKAQSGDKASSVPVYTNEQKAAGRDMLKKSYAILMRQTADLMVAIATDKKLPLMMADVHAATYSQFSLMQSAGYIPKIAPTPPKPKTAPPPPVQQPEPEYQEEVPDDLTF